MIADYGYDGGPVAQPGAIPARVVAAYGDYYRIRVHFPRPADHLPALSVGDVGHRAGIDHIDVCLLSEIDNGKARRFQAGVHGIGLVFIYLAAKRMQGRCFSIKLQRSDAPLSQASLDFLVS